MFEVNKIDLGTYITFEYHRGTFTGVAIFKSECVQLYIVFVGVDGGSYSNFLFLWHNLGSFDHVCKLQQIQQQLFEVMLIKFNYSKRFTKDRFDNPKRGHKCVARLMRAGPMLSQFHQE